MANRLGTFIYKGILLAGVGFAAGLMGTAFSNGLIKLRKKMDPNFETPNKAPLTLLNSLTCTTHMGWDVVCDLGEVDWFAERQSQADCREVGSKEEKENLGVRICRAILR